METMERVGEVCVDAGMLLIGDPCYLIPNDDGSARNPALATWPAFCAAVSASRTTDGTGEPIGNGLGVVISDFGGDGNYPVDVVRSFDGTIEKLVVTFREPDPDEDGWEY